MSSGTLLVTFQGYLLVKYFGGVKYSMFYSTITTKLGNMNSYSFPVIVIHFSNEIVILGIKRALSLCYLV